MKYIDAEELKAEIERQQKRLILLSNTEQVSVRRDCALQNGVYSHILEIIDSLHQEQPEVDLEKEIDHFWDSCIKHKNERGGNVIWCNKIEIEALFRYVFELGLKSK